MDYKILLEIKGVYNETYTEENISLGTSVKETLDKSYDVGTLELLLTRIPEEYQPYTPVSLTIYSQVKNEDNMEYYDEEDKQEYITTELESYSMVIESDIVEEVYIGANLRYTHRLTLIEETKLLETEMMPNITFTQPIQNLTFKGIELIPPAVTQCIDTEATRHIFPENKFFKQIYPGSKFPTIPIEINLEFLSQSWLAHIVLPIIYSIWSACNKDKKLRFSIYPSSVKLIKKDGSKSYELANAITSTIESAQKHMTKSQYKYTVSEDRSDWFYAPEDLEAGEYNLVYSYDLKEFWLRDFTWAPISTRWEKIDIGYMPTRSISLLAVGITAIVVGAVGVVGGISEDILHDAIDSAKIRGSLAKLVNQAGKVVYADLIYTPNEDSIIQSSKITLKEVMENIESQIKVQERMPLMSRSNIGTKYASENRVQTDIINVPNIPDAYIGIEETSTMIEKFYNDDTILNSNIITIIDCYRSDELSGEVRLKTIKANRKFLKAQSKTLYIQEKIPEQTEYLKISFLSTHFTLNNLNINVFTASRPKYKFSDEIKAIAHSIIAPEYTFEKKSLWEICLEIGEMFNGIPVLNDGVIDYIILDDREPVKLDVDKESLQKEANMTNYATKLYTSDLKNIIQDEENDEVSTYSTYPYPGGWVKVRAANYFETTINRETAALVIDNENTGIYRLRRVLCKFMYPDKNGEKKPHIVNITNYVLEKNIYDSLSTEVPAGLTNNEYSVSEKGTKAYYERGKNCIYNLAQLPENGSVIGWKQTYLTIQYILLNASATQYGLSSTSKNIFDYEFQIEYYPYHSRLNVARQSNLNNIYNQVTNNLNQTSNNVSSVQFSKHTEELLNKLGNAELSTHYTSNSVIEPITIGDCVVLNGKNYYINDMISTYNNNDKTVQLLLTKDNYKQNNRIAVSREYRQYNIDSSNVLRKTLTKPLTIVVSNEILKKSENSAYIGNHNSSNRRTLAKSIVNTLADYGNTLRPITNAFVHPEDKQNKVLQYNTFRTDVAASTCKNKILPIIGDVLGNTITLQWDMYDNYSAGRIVRQPNEGTNSWFEQVEVTIGGVTLKEKDYGIKIQDDARYCDDNGQTPMIYTELFSNNAQAFPSNISETLPDTGITRDGISNYIENSLSFEFEANKDSREALSFQATISAQTFDKDIKIKNLLRYNPLAVSSERALPKWYGYNKNNLPSNYHLYSFYSSYELDQVITHTEDTSSNTTIIEIQITNNVKNAIDFDGYILCYDNGEVLLDVRKPLKAGDFTYLYFNIFDDEVSLKDIDNYKIERNKVIDIREFQPIVYLENEKFYVDVQHLQDTLQLEPDEITIALGTKHSTLPRGIQKGYHGRRYAKHKKGDSLYIVGNNWKYNGVNYGRMYVLDNGEIVFKTKEGNYINVYNYLNTKYMSKNDSHIKGEFKLNWLKYFFVIIYERQRSLQSSEFTVRYEPVEVTNPITKQDDVFGAPVEIF